MSFLFLKVLYPQQKDSGVYECQISTTPPVGYSVVFSVVGERNLATHHTIASQTISCKSLNNWKFTHVKELTPKLDSGFDEIVRSNFDCYSLVQIDNVGSKFPVHSSDNPFFIALFVHTEPTTTILGTPEMYIDTGSTVNLTCIVHGLNEPPTAIQWTHNGYVSDKLPFIRLLPFGWKLNLQTKKFNMNFSFHSSKEINYDSPRGGVSVITEKSDITTSYLLIQRAKPADSGKYTCRWRSTFKRSA